MQSEKKLEKEFETFKKFHKISVLGFKISQYYETLQNTGITIPTFLLEKPETLALRDVKRLMFYNPETFENLYELAWQELAEKLP